MEPAAATRKQSSKRKKRVNKTSAMYHSFPGLSPARSVSMPMKAELSAMPAATSSANGRRWTALAA